MHSQVNYNNGSTTEYSGYCVESTKDFTMNSKHAKLIREIITDSRCQENWKFTMCKYGRLEQSKYGKKCRFKLATWVVLFISIANEKWNDRDMFEFLKIPSVFK